MRRCARTTPTRSRTARDRRWRGVPQRFLQREDFRLFAGGTSLVMAEGHDDDRGNGLLLRDEIVHDGVGHAGLRPAALVVVGAVQQVHHRILLVAGVVVGRRVDHHTAGNLVHLVEVVVLDQVAVWHVAEHHEVRFLPRQGDDALVDAGRRTNEGVLRIGSGESVHFEPVLVVARRELRGRERPDAIGVFGHVETGGAVDRGVAKLGHVGNTRTFLALGAWKPEGDGVVGVHFGGAGVGDNAGLDPRPAPASGGAAAPRGIVGDLGLDGSGHKRCERRCRENAKDSVHHLCLTSVRGAIEPKYSKKEDMTTTWFRTVWPALEATATRLPSGRRS